MQKDIIVKHRDFLPDHGTNFVADVPTVFHCHHFNLFWDQTIDDALGAELGTVIRTNAARESFYDLLKNLADRVGASTSRERLELAQTVFSAMGQGSLTLDLDVEGGRAASDHLHYGHCWNEKYGHQVRRRHPADAVAAGFTAAACELAFGLQRESVRCKEIECVAKRDRHCSFVAERSDPSPLAAPMTRAQVLAAVGDPIMGLLEDRIQPIVDGLRGFTAGVLGDERGLISAFGLFVSHHPSTYYNRSGYDAFRHVMRTAPQSAEVMRQLLREAGHVCAFNTFGGIMLSPEWEGLVGAPSGDPDETLVGSLAIARALGFGQWCAHEFEPGRRLVLRTPGSYESTYYVNREGRAANPMCFFLQGAVLATMQLIDRVPWAERPELTPQFYGQLFKEGMPWRAEETQCMSRGDPLCEVVVTRG